MTYKGINYCFHLYIQFFTGFVYILVFNLKLPDDIDKHSNNPKNVKKIPKKLFKKVLKLTKIVT
jgi:hypothetical protein